MKNQNIHIQKILLVYNTFIETKKKITEKKSRCLFFENLAKLYSQPDLGLAFELAQYLKEVDMKFSWVKETLHVFSNIHAEKKRSIKKSVQLVLLWKLNMNTHNV